MVTKLTAVNEPESADECEQMSVTVADNSNDVAMDMEGIPEGKCYYMDL